MHVLEIVLPTDRTLFPAALLVVPVLLFAMEEEPRPPHYFKTTINSVNGSGSNVVVRDYIDGMGRNVQSQRKINRTSQGFSSVVSGNEYDELNRPVEIILPDDTPTLR